ncbi:MAG: hypothetical protein CHACPFDD_03343 [Phycisphaerae bacterium]|nr:hypothetical protein [Phycisphaerae bacterium]
MSCSVLRSAVKVKRSLSGRAGRPSNTRCRLDASVLTSTPGNLRMSVAKMVCGDSVDIASGMSYCSMSCMPAFTTAAGPLMMMRLVRASGVTEIWPVIRRPLSLNWALSCACSHWAASGAVACASWRNSTNVTIRAPASLYSLSSFSASASMSRLHVSRMVSLAWSASKRVTMPPRPSLF